MLKHVVHIVLSNITYKDWVQFLSLTHCVVMQKMKSEYNIFRVESETGNSRIGLLRTKRVMFDLGYLDQIQHIVTEVI
jgi:hypothetical protein